MTTTRQSIPYFVPAAIEPTPAADVSPAVPPEVVHWVRSYGGTASTALFDPGYQRFETPGIDGAIAYKIGFGCAIAVGDPVCEKGQQLALATAFRDRARAKRLPCAFSVVGESFAKAMAADGAAALCFGKELGFDPRRDPSTGSKGRELRKKLNHAKRAGLVGGEYRREPFANARTERELESVVQAWLAARRGPQVFLTGVHLFEAPSVTRWFYVRHGDSLVAVLTTLQLDALGGYLMNHCLTAPGAPDGTSEILVAHTLATLGAEDCSFATFGAAPDRALGDLVNLSARSQSIARRVFATAGNAFHLDARTRYRRKFQATREAPSYLVFSPGTIGVRQLGALSKAFNVSLP